MSEQELKSFASQLRCPEGEEGITMGERMNSSNGNMIQSAIDALEWRDHDFVVEIGPGNGYHIQDILKRADAITYKGIDISETMIHDATQRNKKLVDAGLVSFQLTSAEIIPLPDTYADKLITVNTIYFWPNPLAYLKEITRVLKPGGQLAIAFATESFMKNLPFVQYGFELYTADKVSMILLEAGYIIKDSIKKTEQVQMAKDVFVEREFYVILAQS